MTWCPPAVSPGRIRTCDTQFRKSLAFLVDLYGRATAKLIIQDNVIVDVLNDVTLDIITALVVSAGGANLII